jgi:Long-chain acyl-CoA synthetases (AMP-forming)
MSTGRAGAPTTVCDIRLVDWDEGNYRVCDKPFPRGEILIGGSNISPGYYKNPTKTKEDFFDEEGKRWFRTGDIGELHQDGVIRIIDRKKDLVKLQAGEYVSLGKHVFHSFTHLCFHLLTMKQWLHLFLIPYLDVVYSGKVEAELKTCPVIENICVYGDSRKDYTVALVVPNPSRLKEIAEKLNLDSLTFQQLCTHPEIEKQVLVELQEHGKKSKYFLPTLKFRNNPTA